MNGRTWEEMIALQGEEVTGIWDDEHTPPAPLYGEEEEQEKLLREQEWDSITEDEES